MGTILIAPEAPETKLFINLIKNNFLNKKIKNIYCFPNSKFRKGLKNFDLIDNFNKKISNVFAIGKTMYIKFGDFYIQFIPKGSGTFSPIQRKSSCIRFTLEDDYIFYYDDNKNYGDVNILNENMFFEYNQKRIYNPFDDWQMHFDKLKSFVKVSTCVAKSLYNDNFFPGVGLYLRSEALYLSKINPYTPGPEIKTSQLETILDNLHKVCIESYNSNGIIDQFYSNTEIIKQNYFNKCNVFYQPKDKLGNRVILSVKPQDSKTLFYVPEIQGKNE